MSASCMSTSCTVDQDEIYCPITGQIFFEPVIASDGQVYEKTAIHAWFKTHNSSPITKSTIINKNLVDCFMMKRIVDSAFKTNPELRKDQFFCINPYRLVTLIKKGDIEQACSLINKDTNDTIIFDNKDDIDVLLKSDQVMDSIIDNKKRICSIQNMCIIFHAIKICSEEIQKKLVTTCGMDDLIMRNKYKVSALHMAARQSSFEIMKLIIDRGVSVQEVTYVNNNVLHYACHDPSNEGVKKVEYLIKKKINLKSINSNGSTPLHVASKYSSPDTCRLLIEHGAVINSLDKHQTHPFHNACRYNTDKVVDIFINMKIDPNTPAKHNSTPLHCAILNTNNNINIINTLLKIGANPNIKDKHGVTPARLLLKSKIDNPKILKMLIDAGGNINDNVNTLSLYGLARAENLVKCATLLKKYGAKM